MTNSEHNFSSQKVLDRLSDLLDEERLVKEIDEMVDVEAHNFQLKISPPINTSKFNRLVSSFVKNIYKTGLRLPIHLSEPAATAEAVYLLENYYQNEGSKGYDGALFDAVGTNIQGFELVLARLAESIKLVERTKYIKWVFADNFLNLNWKQQHHIVSFYLRQNKELLPAEFSVLKPARLIDCFQELFITHMSTKSMVRQILNAGRSQSA
jgi:hypothetical protein